MTRGVGAYDSELYCVVALQILGEIALIVAIYFLANAQLTVHPVARGCVIFTVVLMTFGVCVWLCVSIQMRSVCLHGRIAD